MDNKQDTHVIAAVARIEESVTWIKDNIRSSQEKDKTQDKRISDVEKKVWWFGGVVGAVELFSHFSGLFKP